MPMTVTNLKRCAESRLGLCCPFEWLHVVVQAQCYRTWASDEQSRSTMDPADWHSSLRYFSTWSNRTIPSIHTSWITLSTRKWMLRYSLLSYSTAFLTYLDPYLLTFRELHSVYFALYVVLCTVSRLLIKLFTGNTFHFVAKQKCCQMKSQVIVLEVLLRKLDRQLSCADSTGNTSN